MSEKNVPNVRFKGFSESWEQRKLENMATFLKGKGYSKSDLVNKGYPIILYGRMYTNYETVIDQITDTFVTDISDAQISTSGDVIVPGSGETAMDISRASNVKISGVVLGGDINIIKPNLKSLDSTFLAYTISNGKQQKELTKRAQGKSVVHLHNSDLKKVVLNVPSKAEQIKIATLLQKIESAIASNQRKLDQLKEVKKLLMQKIFDQEWRFKGFTDPWEQRKLKQLTNSVYQGVNTAADKVKYSDSGVPILQAKHITDGSLNFNNTKFLNEKVYESYFPKYAPKRGDILFANIGTIGPSVLVNSSKNFLIAWNILKLSVENKVYAKFVQYQMVRLNEKHYFSKIVTGNATKFINKNDLLNVQIEIPLLREQKETAKILIIIDKLIASNQQKLDQLKEMKKWFMQNMFV